jgi:membrane-bound metal-dependent hydrolase YbcI (DUF457 family)
MTGKTHKFIGLVAGGAAAYYGMFVLKDTSHLFYVIAMPVGAMIADIDHDHAKLGKARKNIMAAISTLFASLAIVAVSFFLVNAYIEGRDALLSAILTVLMILLPFLALSALSKMEFVQNNLKFVVKHRGLMHTLIIPGFMFAATFFIKEPPGIDYSLFKIVVIGLTIGYTTHLLADMLTTRGCPIFFPLSKKNFNILNIKTGGAGEYIAAAIISICIGALFAFGIIKI